MTTRAVEFGLAGGRPQGQKPIVTIEGITKHFPGVQALGGVALELFPGEVVGLSGENGCGKSTLAKILAGRHRPDRGRIMLAGEPVSWGQPADALAAGIGLIAQEVLVNADLTVGENLLFGLYPRRFGMIDWAETHRQAASHLERYGLPVSSRARVGDLALHERHMISIIKMVLRRPRVLILDEPTSSLVETQVAMLTRMIEEVKLAGAAVVYITHRLREYFMLCDRIVVLRDGQVVANRPAADLSEDELVRLMVGRELSSIFDRSRRDRPRPEASAPVVLSVRNLCNARVTDASLTVRAGEIVGIAGQAGSGRSSLLRSLFGAQPARSGSITVAGQTCEIMSPRQAMAAGIAYVPEDRRRQGLVLDGSVQDNLILPSLADHARAGLRNRAREDATVAGMSGRMRIRAPSGRTITRALSGGNQQKIVIGKWVATRPRLLLLDEPTRGVDIGAKDEIYRIIETLAAEGVGVLMVSSELLELIRLCDRILVMAHGQVVGEVEGDRATEENITRLSFTVTKERKTP